MPRQVKSVGYENVKSTHAQNVIRKSIKRVPIEDDPLGKLLMQSAAIEFLASLASKKG